MADNDTCREHSGCLTDIKNLKNENISQWSQISKMNDRIDAILSRLNVILGGIVVACILLIINVFVKVN